jgi:hypothetical protein
MSNTPAEAGPPVATSTVDRINKGGTGGAGSLTSQHGPQSRCDEAPARQPALEPLPGPREPAAERRHGPAEPVGRLLVGQPVKIAKHDRQALTFGQAVDLRVQNRSHIEVEPGLVIGA